MILAEHILNLDIVEDDIIWCLHNAGLALGELGKHKSHLKQAVTNIQDFLSHLEQIEVKLAGEIDYLASFCTNQFHQGSHYESQKVLTMAQHRVDFTRWRIDQLEVLREVHKLGSDISSL